MNRLFASLAAFAALCSCGAGSPPGSIGDPYYASGPAYDASTRIVDHSCMNILSIPEAAIRKAKDDLHVLYGHSSHGRQITSGMNGLDAFLGGNGLYASKPLQSAGALDLRDEEDLRDGEDRSVSDLGNPDRTAWADATRAYLAAHPEINVVIWSWCGQVGYATESDIEAYLALMEGLEAEYPTIAFVYMTGHHDGGGLGGTLHQRNERIRQYCEAHDKWLFDFADFEARDPDGAYYGDRLVMDSCTYDADGDGTVESSGESSPSGDNYTYARPTGGDRNWAEDWMAAHPQDWFESLDHWGNGYHAPHALANMKAFAAWWMWAAIAASIE
jgi:hypothetical protein